MPEHVTEWLNALLDGELHGPRLRQVQDHLAGCAICRADLDDLSKLSVMLKQAAPAAAEKPADRFISELTLVLPRRADRGRSGPGNVVWWLAPAGAVAVWGLLQAGLTISGLISTAGAAGLLDGAGSWLSSAPQHTEWFSAALGLFGGHLGGIGLNILDLLDGLEVVSSDLTARLAWQAGFGLLYWAGLAVWLTQRIRLDGPTPSQAAPAGSLPSTGPDNPQV